MKRRIVINGRHKILISPIDNKTCKVTWYEKMGDRYVKLGPSEIWNITDALNEFVVPAT